MKLRYKVLGGIAIVLVVAIASLGVMLSHDSPCTAAPPLAADTPSMKAIVYRCYGGVEVLKLEQIAKPLPEDGRVLVKVHAASVNPLDWHYMQGKPYVMRPMSGVGKPNSNLMGADFAGTVEAVGKNVTRFKIGDEVFGDRDGAFGEYVSVRENGAMALKPDNITMEQAAAVPIAGLTALQALRDKGKVQAGQKVLINGASGRRGYLCGADCENLRRRSDGSLQHPKRGDGQVHRRRSRHRLHQGGFHPRIGALRFDRRQCRQP